LTDAFVLAFLIWYRMRKLVVPPSPARALSVPYKLLWALPTTVAEVAVIDETDPPMGSVVSPCPAQAFGPFSPGAIMVCTQVGPANTTASRAMARLKVGGGYSTVVSCVRSPSGCLLLPFHARHTARESGQIKEKTEKGRAGIPQKGWVDTVGRMVAGRYAHHGVLHCLGRVQDGRLRPHLVFQSDGVIVKPNRCQ